MQDRYAGDVGDFGKFGMLRQIAGTGMKIGVNWYYTYKPDEHHNDDGKHITYLNNKKFKGCDDELINSLRTVVSGNRSIAALEQSNLIPNSQYYSNILKPGNDPSFSRETWHKDSLEALADSDIIFCDPDNGLLVKSVSLSMAKSDKYIAHDEVVKYFMSGKSVIFYNHRCREKEQKYLRRFESLQLRDELKTAKWKGLKFPRGTIRDYIFAIQPFHYEAVQGAIATLMQSEWNRHFSLLDLNRR